MVYEGTCTLASTNTDSWTAFGNAHLLTVRRLLRVRRLRHLSLIFQASMSLLAVHFHRNVRSSSRALPLHLHFHTRSGVFGFTSSCNVLEPFHTSQSHDHRYRVHPCFLQYLLISTLPTLPIATIIISVVAIRF